MRKLYFIISLMFLFVISCNEQHNDDEEFVDPEIENIENEEELVTTDFDELEEKMEEIMYESDDSDNEVTKDVAVVKSQGAKSVEVSLNIGAGRLVLSGGASELLTGGFIYSNKKWKPEINYKVKDSKGILKIEQPENGDFTINDDDKYVWNLKFNNEMPLHFNIELGAGLSEIALSELNLKHFHMVMGVGKTEIDLRGKWKQSTEIYLDGGIGLSQVYLPDNVGVKLEVVKGIGGVDIKNLTKKKSSVYVNKSYENSDIVLNIFLKTGIGKIEVE
jgi:hypothetical protein